VARPNMAVERAEPGRRDRRLPGRQVRREPVAPANPGSPPGNDAGNLIVRHAGSVRALQGVRQDGKIRAGCGGTTAGRRCGGQQPGAAAGGLGS
jgi:hypothetical protein